MIGEASNDSAWLDPRWGEDAVWALHRSPQSREQARVGLVKAFERVLDLNRIGSRDPVVVVFDGAGPAVQESILLAHAVGRLGLGNVRALLCEPNRGEPNVLELPRLAKLGVTVESLCQREKLPQIVEALARDHRVVINALFAANPAHASPESDPVLQRCAEVAEPYGLVFDREGFFRDDLIRNLREASPSSGGPEAPPPR